MVSPSLKTQALFLRGHMFSSLSTTPGFIICPASLPRGTRGNLHLHVLRPAGSLALCEWLSYWASSPRKAQFHHNRDLLWMAPFSLVNFKCARNTAGASSPAYAASPVVLIFPSVCATLASLQRKAWAAGSRQSLAEIFARAQCFLALSAFRLPYFMIEDSFLPHV